MTILERLRAATGPDRELDADILEAIGGCAHKETEYYCIEDGNDYDSGFTCKKCGEDTYGMNIDRYTASIDAALALVERMLPGCGYTVTRGRFSLDEPLFSSQICRSDLIPDDAGPEPYGFPSGHNSPALAILIALFAALEAKENVK